MGLLPLWKTEVAGLTSYDVELTQASGLAGKKASNYLHRHARKRKRLRLSACQLKQLEDAVAGMSRKVALTQASW